MELNGDILRLSDIRSCLVTTLGRHKAHAAIANTTPSRMTAEVACDNGVRSNARNYEQQQYSGKEGVLDS